MDQTQIKTILVNILTGGIITGVIIAGYYVLVKKNIPKLDGATTVAQIADETALIGNEIDATKKDLKDLDRAVESSTIIFKLPEFMNLENFTAPVPTEEVGRKNPFVLTVWKLKIKAIIDAAPKVATPEPPKPPAASEQTQETEETDGI